MSVTERHSWRPGRWAVIAAGLLFVLLAAVACGADAETEQKLEFGKVVSTDRVYTIEDFFAIGFRKNKQYSVEELPAGVDAWSGFWGLDPYDRKDYELRFYASHEDAVEYGPALAEEVTGEDAELYRKNPTWKEGAKDRWQSALGFTGATTSLMPSGPSPIYGDFAILDNVLMLCQGADSQQGLEQCEALVDALVAAAEE